MGVAVAIEHRTTYRFDGPAVLGPHLVRLRPAPHSRTPIESYSLTVEPQGTFVNWQQDPFGNHVARLVFPKPVNELDITVQLVADLTTVNPFDFFIEPYAAQFPFRYPDRLASDLAPYLVSVGEDAAGSAIPAPEVRAFIDDHRLTTITDVPTVAFLSDLNKQVSEVIEYETRLEQGVQSPGVTLQRSIGSCRDSAWLLVSLARELGLAARFVSGYLVQLVPDDSHDANAIGEDIIDLHAWAEMYLPGAGWVGLDATSGLFAGEGHIPLSASPFPAESAPVTGTRTGGGTATLEYSNTVTRLTEEPRTTRPYEDTEWQAILALGHVMDERLEAGDVRLTMGGEPTFVSATNTAGPEWNVAADGDDKRWRASALATRLKEQYAPAGVVQYGQGKQYPGEPLPRWQICITWRTDGTALWNKAELLSSPWSTGTLKPDEGAVLGGRLLTGVAARLGIADEFVMPLYEDRLAQIVAESQAPEGDPPDVDIVVAPGRDARKSLIESLDADAGEPAGWVLPLHRSEDETRWATTRWHTRRGRLVLLAGASPIGLRLPLNSISWTLPPYRPDPSPFAPHVPLPSSEDARAAAIEPAEVVDVDVAPRTALTAECRDGHLFAFVPPLQSVDAGVALLAAIEAAAAEIGTPLVLEGYGLPADERLRSLTVTPDPGVIEVNVQPCDSWRDLVALNETLDAAARASGLVSEKFMYDGSHVGTGGGSHLTLGGRTPADSPLLRRPSLLRSMLTFWQNHPSLSYLFSGRFVGSTCQAPRVDEGRDDALYELEIAFAELDRLSDPDESAVRPWAVDRALRHLLTDITGNTHRSEFCIDKLFSPDHDRGRLGLLELRGFEMPPHVRMSLVQVLLVRCLVTRFWYEPCRRPLVRWGGGLHDRFMLPAFVARDLDEVVADLNRHGIAFERGWLALFERFRFPLLGKANFGPTTLSVHRAIEPWRVLGEEATASGTARYVDSSVERVQVSLSGAVSGRHLLTCNGVEVPLHPVTGSSELVAGIRYRAWSPPSGLHPTLGVHAPLVFEVVDGWNDSSLGGFTYHVTHPAGVNYDAPPVNAKEAEARRDARLVAGGHVPRVELTVADRAPVTTTAEYPVTLDLRRMLLGTGTIGAAREGRR